MYTKTKPDPQKRKRQKSNGVFLPADLINSKAWLDIAGKWNCQVFIEFMRRRKMRKRKNIKGKRGNDWVIENNGEIVFTYNEAIDFFGFDRKCFTKAVDKLIEVGFLDITHQGTAQGDPSTYYISERWRKYGTPDFKQQKRRKGTRKPGWSKCAKLKNSVGETPLVQVGETPLVQGQNGINEGKNSTGSDPQNSPQVTENTEFITETSENIKPVAFLPLFYRIP